MMDTLRNLLAQWHYLNHPYLSTISATILLLIGAFVFLKNLKSRLYGVFFWMTFVIANWFFGNVMSMFYYRNLAVAVFWYQAAYTTVPFISISYYHFYLALTQKRNPLLYLFYAVGILEVIFLWTYKYVGVGTNALPNVGVYWTEFTPFVWYLSFGLIKYLLISIFAVSSFFKEMKKEAIPLRKKQLMLFVIGLSFLTLGCIEWAVNYNIPVHAAWAVIPPFFAVFAYAIIRYRAMEIDTVIHRTFLWLISILILIIPVGIIHSLLRGWISQLPPAYIIAVDTLVLIVFLAYYQRLKPKIDHFFRRRKYDYYMVLANIGEKIGTELEINNIVNRLFKELKDVLYIRNGLVLIQQPGQKDYAEAGKIGYDSPEAVGSAERIAPHESKISQWINEHKKALEREQIELDPQYRPIKEEALIWLKQNIVEVLIPVIMEDKVSTLVGIGKKENLQHYTAKDIELLEKMGRQIGVTIDNALHHEDIVEKERLDEELKLGREIQMNLLPREVPSVPNLSLEGMMNPAKEIGGDYYDFITLPDRGKIAVVIGDVSGKGVAAGLLMSMVKATIHTLSQEGALPKQILCRTNQFLHSTIGGQKFMTLLYFLWQSEERTLIYSSAGHEHILLWRNQSQNLEVVLSGGFMLGMVPDIDKFLEEKQIKLEPQDKILLYTDGVTEAENQDAERFGLMCLKEVFKKHSHKPAKELMRAVKDEIYSFIGNHPQYDDITLVVMEAT